MSDTSPTLRSWMSAVTEISRAVNAATPLDMILDRVAEQGRTLLGFDSCGVMLDDDTHERVAIAGSSGLRPNYIELVRRVGALVVHPDDATADLPATRAYREGRTVTVPDVRDIHGGTFGRLNEYALEQGYQSILAAPLRNADATVGILIGYFVEPHTFKTEEIELAELLAEQTAHAVQAARLRGAQRTFITDLSLANEELRYRRARFDWAEQQHRRMMQLVLDDIGLDGLVAALADILHASVTVQDAAERTLSKASNSEYVAPPKLDKQTRLKQTLPNRYEAIQVPGEPRQSWVTSVALGGEVVGHLWVVGLPDSPDPGQLHLIERFALVVGMEVLKQRYIVEVQERHSGDLMADLLRTEGIVHPRALVQRAAALGHDLRSPHWLAVFTAEPDSMLAPLARSARGMAQASECLVGVYDNTLVLLLLAEQNPLPLLRRLQEHLEGQLKLARVTSVVTPQIVDLSEYTTNYHVAVRAARLRNSTGYGGLIDLRGLPLTVLLLMASAMPVQLRRFAEQLIAPLAGRDDRRDTELVATLREWLASGFSTSTTAAKLVVHVNTVGYRLAKIEQLVERDLRNPETRLELQLAVRIWDILRSDVA